MKRVIFLIVRVIIGTIVLSFVLFKAFKGGQFGTFEWVVYISLLIGLIIELIESHDRKRVNSS